MDELCSFLDHTYGDVARICGDAVWEECEEDTEQIVNEINAVAPHSAVGYASDAAAGDFSGTAQENAECTALVRCRHREYIYRKKEKNGRSLQETAGAA